MKKLFLLIVVSIIFSFIFASEKEVVMKVNQKGEVKQEDTWRVLTEAETSAYLEPGKEIPNFRTLKFKQVDIFYCVPYGVYDQLIKFSDGKFNVITRSGREYGKQIFAWHIIFLLGALLLTILSMFQDMERKKNIFDIPAVIFIAFAFGYVAIFSEKGIPYSPTGYTQNKLYLTTLFTCFISIFNVIDEEKKYYKIFYTIFYILITVDLLLSYFE